VRRDIGSVAKYPQPGWPPVVSRLEDAAVAAARAPIRLEGVRDPEPEFDRDSCRLCRPVGDGAERVPVGDDPHSYTKGGRRITVLRSYQPLAPHPTTISGISQ